MFVKLKTYLVLMTKSLLGRLSLLFLCLTFMFLSSLNLYIGSKLPDERTIRDIELQIPLKIFSSDKTFPVLSKIIKMHTIKLYNFIKVNYHFYK